MFITQEIDENPKNIKRKESEELRGNWDSLGDELLFLKNKFEFTQKEKKFIKKLLTESPPQLLYRRRVIDNFFIIILLFSYG